MSKETVDLSPYVRPHGDVQYLPYDTTLHKDATDRIIVDRYNQLLKNAIASNQSLIMITYQNETLRRLNPKLQAIVNPLSNGKYLTGFASVYRVNDPVRHLVNWYKKTTANDGVSIIKVLMKFCILSRKFYQEKQISTFNSTSLKIDTMGYEWRDRYCCQSNKLEHGSQVYSFETSCCNTRTQ